jgi:hypothetical protein
MYDLNLLIQRAFLWLMANEEVYNKQYAHLVDRIIAPYHDYQTTTGR